MNSKATPKHLASMYVLCEVGGVYECGGICRICVIDEIRTAPESGGKTCPCGAREPFPRAGVNRRLE